MIIVSGRRLIIPSEERHIGFIGDNLVEKRIFCLKDKSLFDMNFCIDIKNTGETVLPKKSLSEEENSLYLEWNITAGALKNEPTLEFQLRGFEAYGNRVWHSEKNHFLLSSSIDADRELTEEELDEFHVMEKQIAATFEQTKALYEKTDSLCSEAKSIAEYAKNELVVSMAAVEEEIDGIKENQTSMKEDILKLSEKLTEATSEHADIWRELTTTQCDIGDISAALDGIIEVEEGYIGG